MRLVCLTLLSNPKKKKKTRTLRKSTHAHFGVGFTIWRQLDPSQFRSLLKLWSAPRLLTFNPPISNLQVDFIAPERLLH